MRINKLEPLLEPWSAHAYALKPLGAAVLAAKIYSERVLQLNVSLALQALA